jgi:hypothetical protein
MSDVFRTVEWEATSRGGHIKVLSNLFVPDPFIMRFSRTLEESLGAYLLHSLESSTDGPAQYSEQYQRQSLLGLSRSL